jgi:hypothetical protein
MGWNERQQQRSGAAGAWHYVGGACTTIPAVAFYFLCLFFSLIFRSPLSLRGDSSHLSTTYNTPYATATGVRNAYAAHAQGATGFYADSGSTYTNPHDRGVHEMLVKHVRDNPEIWAPPPPPRPKGPRVVSYASVSGRVVTYAQLCLTCQACI